MSTQVFFDRMEQHSAGQSRIGHPRCTWLTCWWTWFQPGHFGYAGPKSDQQQTSYHDQKTNLVWPGVSNQMMQLVAVYSEKQNDADRLELSSDCCSASSLSSSLCLASCRPMGQSSGTVNMDKVFLDSSSFRAEAYTFSAMSRTFSSTSWREILVN